MVRVDPEPFAVRLDVEDDGPAFSPEFEAGAIEVFRTTKKDGPGIRLFSVKHCVDLHGGHTELGRSPLGGARVSVWLPLGEGTRPSAN